MGTLGRSCAQQQQAAHQQQQQAWQLDYAHYWAK